MVTGRKNFIVRIHRTASRVPAGMGVVVGDRHIVTCAHVVNTALRRNPRDSARPGPDATIKIDFPLRDGTAAVPLNCRIETWSAPPAAGISTGDIAGLITDEPMPLEVRPARLMDSAGAWNMAASIFGYPQDPAHPRESGAWARVFIVGAVGTGSLQLDAVKEGTFRVRQGYSGSPVIIADEAGDAVVGILSATSSDEEIQDSYERSAPARLT